MENIYIRHTFKKQCCGSVELSGSADPFREITDPDPASFDSIFFLNSFKNKMYFLVI